MLKGKILFFIKILKELNIPIEPLEEIIGMEDFSDHLPIYCRLE